LFNTVPPVSQRHKHFKVEQFLTPEELLTLTKNPDGEKAMLVVISEYYYGINIFFKRQLAGKRITKVVHFTRENDAFRAEYAAEGAKLLTRLDASEALLKDIATIDNTMAGAKQRLEAFGTYKTNQKNQVVTLQMQLTGTFDNLSLRLSNNNRPSFTPEATIAPATLSTRIGTLTATESVEPALHAELSRQLRLLHLHAKHTAEAEKLLAWIKEKLAELKQPIAAVSSGDARKQLKLFESFVHAAEAKESGVFASLREQSAHLEQESYESLADARAREDGICTGFEDIAGQQATNRPILEDNLQRELFKEEVLMKVDVHTDINDNLMVWGGKKLQYLLGKHLVGSVQEARLQLSTLDAAEQEIADTKLGNLARLKELGEEIRQAKYETELSTWQHPQPDEIVSLEAAIDASFNGDLGPAVVHKRVVLDDHLAREQVKEKVQNWVDGHSRKHFEIGAWCENKKEYLSTKEVVAASAEATYQLSVLDSFTEEFATFSAGEITALFEAGTAIRDEKYESEHSNWSYPAPEEVTMLEDAVNDFVAELQAGETNKRAILEDDLARELYTEETHLLGGQHVDKALQCAGWANEKATQLQEDVVVHSMREARVGLSVLAAYSTEKVRFTETAVTSLKALGVTLLARKYETALSKYIFESPEEVSDREAEVDDHWTKLDALATSRNKTLEGLLVRETRKEELRVDFADKAGDVSAYCGDQIALIGEPEGQKLTFGSTVQEVEAHGPSLAALDTTVDEMVANKRGQCELVVQEMAELVRATTRFDEAQTAANGSAAAAEDETATAEAAAAAQEAEAAMATPRTKRKNKFGTLSKTLKRAFGKSKRKKQQLADMQEADGADGESSADGEIDWPEATNPYTSLSVANLREKKEALDAAQTARQATYAAELARWQEDDAMCKAMVDFVAPIHVLCCTMMQSMGAAGGGGGTEEDQLTAVTDALASLQDVCFKLPEGVKMATELADRGVTVNPYTVVTVDMLECELESIQTIAASKKPHLEVMIEYKKFKGITPAQYDEMETLFNEHDTDNSKSISDTELRKCLYGARFQTESCTRGCHWIPRMFA
jgi:hypothetical protein